MLIYAAKVWIQLLVHSNNNDYIKHKQPIRLWTISRCVTKILRVAYQFFLNKRPNRFGINFELLECALKVWIQLVINSNDDDYTNLKQPIRFWTFLFFVTNKLKVVYQCFDTSMKLFGASGLKCKNWNEYLKRPIRLWNYFVSLDFDWNILMTIKIKNDTLLNNQNIINVHTCVVVDTY